MAMYKVTTMLGMGIATSKEDLNNMLVFLDGVKAGMGLTELPMKIEEIGLPEQPAAMIEDVDEQEAEIAMLKLEEAQLGCI